MHLDRSHQRRERIVQHGRQHPAHLGRPVVGLDPGQDQVEIPLLDEGLQDGGNAPAVRSIEGFIGKQHGVFGAHGHLAAQDLFVILAAHRGHGDGATSPIDDLQRLFDRVVVRLIHRINQIVAFDVVSRPIQLDFVFRSIGHSFCAD